MVIFAEYYYDFRDNQTLSVKQNGTYSTVSLPHTVQTSFNNHQNCMLVVILCNGVFCGYYLYTVFIKILFKFKSMCYA